MRTERKTDMTKLKVAFRNFVNAYENQPVNVVQGNRESCETKMNNFNAYTAYLHIAFITTN